MVSGTGVRVAGPACHGGARVRPSSASKLSIAAEGTAALQDASRTAWADLNRRQPRGVRQPSFRSASCRRCLPTRKRTRWPWQRIRPRSCCSWPRDSARTHSRGRRRHNAWPTSTIRFTGNTATNRSPDTGAGFGQPARRLSDICRARSPHPPPPH